MSTRSSHADINERRLRPIYDYLDSGNNKKAVQEADRLLKKQKDFACARVLRSLALIRLGRQDESMVTLQEVHAQHPSDEHTLQAMAMCYRDLNRLDLLADMYENAHKSKPDSEEILNSLFMAYVRLGMCKKQQQVAMLLHKLRPQKNPYYFWAVMSIVMQAHGDHKLGQTMYFPLAEKMTLKYIQEGKLEAEAEVRLYIIILQCMKKYNEILEVIQGPLSAKLTSEPDFPKYLKGEMLIKLERWPEVNAHYRQLLLSDPDHWQCYKEYFNSLFKLIDSNWSPDCCGDICLSKIGPVDYTLDLAVEFIKGQSRDCSNHQLRGPILAQLELKRLLKERGDSRCNEVFDCVLEIIGSYFQCFGDKPCCYSDLCMFTGLVDTEQLQHLLTDQISQLGLGTSENGLQFISAVDAKLIQRHISLLQLLRQSGSHRQMTLSDRLVFIESLHRHYLNGLRLGESLLTTDLQYVDSYMLLIVHMIYDLYCESGDEVMIWHAAEFLESAIGKSPANFQFKVLLIQLYCRLGATLPCFTLYEKMDIKHIQHDSLGYLISNHALRFGHVSKAEGVLDTMLRFFATVNKDTSDFLISSYKYGAFPKVHEFVEFKERLLNSLQFAVATVEKLLLDIIRTCSHKATQDIVCSLDVNPLMERTDFDLICDNRDCHVLQCWNPADRTLTEAMKQQSFNEEKAWLRLRNLIARVLVAAGRVTGDLQMPSDNNLKNGNSEHSPIDAVNQLHDELNTVLGQLSVQYGNTDLKQIPLLTSPSRTRLTPYLKLGLGDHLNEMLALLAHLDVIRDDLLSDRLQNLSLNLPSTAKLDTILEQVSVPWLSSKILNVDALENMVLIAEHVCHVCIVMGACHMLLKPVKSSMARRGKKRKESDPRLTSVIDCYSNILGRLIELANKLSSTFELLGTEELTAAFSAMTLTNNSTVFQALHLADSVESVVTCKLQDSYQQTSAEMTSLLRYKLQYLEAIHL